MIVYYYWFCSYNVIDIDECTEGIDGCAQICTDTDGSYTCSCDPGYRLSGDNHGCTGEPLIMNAIASRIFQSMINTTQTLMNAVKIWIAVIIYALIHLDHTYAAAVLAIDFPWITKLAMVIVTQCAYYSSHRDCIITMLNTCKQILMNVLRELTGVSTIVATLMAPMLVGVLLVIELIVTAILAMV